jgi:hypothetical protein
MSACRTAIASLGWLVLQQAGDHVMCKEAAPQATSFTWPAQIEISIQLHPQGTLISLFGSIFGFGSIQSAHLQGQIGNLRNRIEVELSQRRLQAHTTATLADELRKLAELHREGVLTDAEFEQAKTRLLTT